MKYYILEAIFILVALEAFSRLLWNMYTEFQMVIDTMQKRIVWRTQRTVEYSNMIVTGEFPVELTKIKIAIPFKISMLYGKFLEREKKLHWVKLAWWGIRMQPKNIFGRGMYIRKLLKKYGK